MNALKVGTSWPLGTRPATVETVAVELHYPDRTDYWVVEFAAVMIDRAAEQGTPVKNLLLRPYDDQRYGWGWPVRAPSPAPNYWTAMRESLKRYNP